MFVLKIATTVWLALIAFGMVNTSWHCGNVRSDACHSFHVAINIGHSPSGKARDFDSRIRWFKSNMPCSGFTWFPDIRLSSSFHPHSGKLLRAVTRLVRV